MQIPSVSEARALNMHSVFPTLASLVDTARQVEASLRASRPARGSVPSEAEVIAAVTKVVETKQLGPAGVSKRLGPALAKKLAQLVVSEDGETII